MKRDRARHLFADIVRLRRVERELPGSRDVVAVRASLEEQLGAAISQRLAADLLGVSHAALARWIGSGDVPLVVTPNGRREVPVAALLDLYEAVERQRTDGRRHVLEPIFAAQRERAERVRARDLVPEAEQGTHGHRRAELRSLAYHRALAPQLSRASIDEARHLIWTWRERDLVDVRHAERWEALLALPLADVRRTLGEDDPAARELRQTSPFAGMLSEPERRAALEQVDDLPVDDARRAHVRAQLRGLA